MALLQVSFVVRDLCLGTYRRNLISRYVSLSHSASLFGFNFVHTSDVVPNSLLCSALRISSSSLVSPFRVLYTFVWLSERRFRLYCVSLCSCVLYWHSLQLLDISVLFLLLLLLLLPLLVINTIMINYYCYYYYYYYY